MNAPIAQPTCGVFVDMGTTNTRVWLMRGTEILATAREKIGVADSARSGSREKIVSGLKQLLEEVRAHQADNPQCSPTFCLAAGMITSSLGLVEIPRLLAPVGASELAAAIRHFRFPEITELPFYFVPGVEWRGDSGKSPMSCDAMRGEETLCLGLLEEGVLKPNSTLLTLGSHWKAIGVDTKNRIASCVTSLSGELLQAAQTQTILANDVPRNWPAELDRHWVEAGMQEQRASGLARALFGVRLLSQTSTTSPEQRFAFLCGAFIGADLNALLARRALRPDSHVVIAASSPLGEAWRHALALNSIRASLLTEAERDHAFLAGLQLFADSFERIDVVKS